MDFSSPFDKNIQLKMQDDKQIRPVMMGFEANLGNEKYNSNCNALGSHDGKTHQHCIDKKPFLLQVQGLFRKQHG